MAAQPEFQDDVGASLSCSSITAELLIFHGKSYTGRTEQKKKLIYEKIVDEKRVVYRYCVDEKHNGLIMWGARTLTKKSLRNGFCCKISKTEIEAKIMWLSARASFSAPFYYCLMVSDGSSCYKAQDFFFLGYRPTVDQPFFAEKLI